ncbi:MAG: sensor histidine kinase [Spirochaetales bacterium]|nr:sensor histidine kinase [Spirochaetales bacterium]
MDLIQNSVEAGSSLIQLNMKQSADSLDVSIRDNGCGMTDDELKRATDPFYSDGVKHKHRKVGLGLPFLIQTVTMTDGRFDIRSEKGRGTEIDIRFNPVHIDTPPLGDPVALLYQVMCFQGDYDLTAVRSLSKGTEEQSYQVNRKEMLDVLGDLESAASLGLLRDYINSQEEDLLS